MVELPQGVVRPRDAQALNNRDNMGVLASAANIWGPRFGSHLFLHRALISTGPNAHHGCS
jgi:hypothetical protein